MCDKEDILDIRQGEEGLVIIKDKDIKLLF